MKKRKKWKAPPLDMSNVRELWRHVTGEKWPLGWHVEWAGFMRGALGLCIYRERRILLSFADAKRETVGRWETAAAAPGAVATLLHEFVHLRHGPSLRHGEDFRRLENGMRERAGLPLIAVKQLRPKCDHQWSGRGVTYGADGVPLYRTERCNVCWRYRSVKP